MTVVEFGPFEKPIYRALWVRRGWPCSHSCCEKGHRTIRAAATHGARVLRERAVAAWEHKETDEGGS